MSNDEVFIKRKEEILNRIKTAGEQARSGNTPPVFATVSGVLSTKASLIKYCDSELGFGLITTKSFQVTPNSGNREPVICEVSPGNFGNSVGLKNPGMEVAEKDLQRVRRLFRMKALLNISVSASNPDDFITLIRKFQYYADCIELNFSCPHAAAGFGASIGSSAEIASAFVKSIKSAIPFCSALIFVKLTPNVNNIGEIAKAVIAAGADGITAINTVGPVVYTEPHSGKPILQNKLGGKGGKSGAWVFQKAIECIKEIRKAAGSAVPIIGMGGVSSGAKAAEMLKAGADIIGIGSALGTVHQNNWKKYLEALGEDTKKCINGKAADTASAFIIKTPRMKYIPRKIISKKYESADVMILTLEGSFDFKAGQFVFLWIPGVGEKPFSLALDNPATFIIKRRGEFTKALFEMDEGSIIYVRGLYGAPVVTPKTKKAFLIAGGTGVAVLPALARQLKKENTEISTYVGSSESSVKKELNILSKVLKECGSYKFISDNGETARVLSEFESDFIMNNAGLKIRNFSDENEIACYLVGPMVFMKRAADILKAKGVQEKRIFLSLEMNTMCGIGLCGECACGNKLTCQQGTFIRLDELNILE